MKILTLAVAAVLLAPASAFAQDVVKAAPGTSNVAFENAYIRVVRSHFAPGAGEAAHSHPAGWYYVTKGGALTVTSSDGKTETWAARSGSSEWSDGEGAHTARNFGRAPMEYLLVEVKPAPTEHPNR